MPDEIIFWTTYKPIDHKIKLNENILKDYFKTIKKYRGKYSLAYGYIKHYTDENWEDMSSNIQTLIAQKIYEKYQDFLHENT